MNKTKWIIFALIVVAILGGTIWVSKNSGSKSSFTGDASKIITDGPIADQVFGTHDQKVVLIEYGDFQCPACGNMYQPIKDLTTKYKDQVTFIFRNFPLTNIHPNALAGSTAAEAAGRQGKYWEMHDKLYENQSAWSSVAIDRREEVFAGYASELGLNVDQFKKDMASSEVSAKIARDRETGNKIYKINSTPTFVLNGAKIDGQNAVDSTIMQTKLEDAIKQAYGSLPQAAPTAAPAQ